MCVVDVDDLMFHECQDRRLDPDELKLTSSRRIGKVHPCESKTRLKHN